MAQETPLTMGVATPTLKNGTELAESCRVLGSRHHAIRKAQIQALANTWTKMRVRRTLFLSGTILGCLLLAHYPLRRIGIVAAVQLLMLSFHGAQTWRAQGKPIEERRVFGAHMVILCSQAILLCATGGLSSPFIPSLLGISCVTLAVFGKSRESRATVVVASLIVLVLVAMPRAITGPRPDHPWDEVLTAVGLLFSFKMLQRTLIALGDAYHRSGDSLDRMREDVLDASAARARSLESVSSKVAHELKNPLAAIKGLVQLLARGTTEERARERLEVIGGEVARMEAILRDYLSFSRPLEELAIQEVDLASVVDDVASVLEARAENAAVELRRSGPGAKVQGDPRRLKEALLNLMDNAIEATSRGRTVDIAVQRTDDGASLVIRDAGRGLSAEELVRLGTPFYTTREGGTGLGVVLARAVIKQHGGELRYTSELGAGTEAIVTIPDRRGPLEPRASIDLCCEAVAAACERSA